MILQAFNATAAGIVADDQGDEARDQQHARRVHDIRPRNAQKTKSRQTPDTALDVQQQTSIAEDLELLADFIADVLVIGVEFFQFAGEGAGVGGREFRWSADFSPLQHGRQFE